MLKPSQTNPYQAPQSTDLPRTEGMPELAHLGTGLITFFATIMFIGMSHAFRDEMGFKKILNEGVLLKYVVTVVGAVFGMLVGVVAFFTVVILICMFIEKVLKIKL
jgi:hypothetical protein